MKLTPEQQAEFEKTINTMVKNIYSGWRNEDMPVIRKMHPKALLIVPLYRSALVVEKPTPEEEERGSVRLIIYHDPGWMGEKTTPKNLTRHSWEIYLAGQRNGPDVFFWEPPNGCHDSSFLRSISGNRLETEYLNLHAEIDRLKAELAALKEGQH